MSVNISAPLAALVLLGALSGCATAPAITAKLTYETVPIGAEIFEGGKSLGVEPVMRDYSLDGKSGTIQTPDVTAVWPSGAKTSFYTILAAGADRVATLERPANVPGLAIDLDRAKGLAATRQREKERLKALQHSDIQRASARCKEQQAGGGLAVSDDCN